MHFESEVCGARRVAELRRKCLSADTEFFLVPDLQLICDARTVLPPPPLQHSWMVLLPTRHRLYIISPPPPPPYSILF